MNEQIKSLANIWANRRQVEDRLGAVYVFTEESLQVYTNQIVKECARIAEESDTSWSGAGPEAAEQIKIHFGIEE
jgi:hypothetical protein